MLNHDPIHAIYLAAQGVWAVDNVLSGAHLQARFFETTDQIPDDDLSTDTESSDTESSVSAFRSWIFERKHDQFVIVVDSIDETLQQEEIPRLGWQDQRSLLKRRLARVFRETEYSTIRTHTSRQDGQRIRTATLSALKATVSLSPWLDVMLDCEARIRTITSPALLSQQLIARLADAKAGLLVSTNPAGLRQTVVQNGMIGFSRLAALSDMSSNGIVGEVGRSMQYMLMSQQISRDRIRDGDFEIWVVAQNEAAYNELPGSIFLDQSAQIPVRVIDLKKMKIPLVDESPGLSIWINLAANSDAIDYGNERVMKFSRLSQARSVMTRSGLAVAVTGALMMLSVDHVIDYMVPPLTAQARSKAQYQAQRNRLQEQLSKFPASSSQMKQMVDTASQLLNRNIDPEAAIRLLGNALPLQEGFDIETIRWAPADTMLSEQVGNMSAWRDSLPNETGAQSIAGSDLVISGSVSHSWSKSRANMQTQSVADKLSALCNCDLVAIKLPYDPAPEAGLTLEYSGYAVKPRPFRMHLRTRNAQSWALKGVPTKLSAEINTLLTLHGLQ